MDNTCQSYTYTRPKKCLYLISKSGRIHGDDTGTCFLCDQSQEVLYSFRKWGLGDQETVLYGETLEGNILYAYVT